MPEILQKLTPDRDLQCYFERPSAIAALSEASSSGFVVSGTWRQQYDWAVIEWSRDNVTEHPTLRYLPDGDLSGLILTYTEARENCIPIDSSWYPTVDWPFLRIWADAGDGETLYKVRLIDHAEPVNGLSTSAWAEFELTGSVTPGDYVELAWLSEHYTVQLFVGQTLEDGASIIAEAINAESPTATATATGAKIRITWKSPGANGNRIGVYGNVSGAGTECWEPQSQTFHDGWSPQSWRVTLNFGRLVDIEGRAVPTASVRKMRWTYAADIQTGAFQRSEFSVRVSEWSVTGERREYHVAGFASRRAEDDSDQMAYSGNWDVDRGNFSGGSIHRTGTPGASVTFEYHMPRLHRLFAGIRRHETAPVVSIVVDTIQHFESLALRGEDVLIRLDLGDMGAGIHSVTIQHAGGHNETFYFDFIEMAIPTLELPEFPVDSVVTLATDWDTDHSIPLAPERTAWLMHKLGFHGRANNYVGAMWFYELCRPGNRYSSAKIEFIGAPPFGGVTELTMGPTMISHRNLIGDTAETIAKAFEFEINAGSTGLWASAVGPELTLHSRAMGKAGDAITIAVHTNSESFTAALSGPSLAGGQDGDWLTDLEAMPRINRAARDWSRSFYRALKGYGIDVAAAFSMELQHGDPSPSTGIAQRYPGGKPALLLTPALQTNFSPISTEFWKQVYLDMAQVMAEGGCAPYLQFGEVQWWYFPSDGGMPFYDDYTKSRFQALYGRPMHIFVDGSASPSAYPEECDFLPTLIGEFTDSIMAYVRQTYPETRFEVLYPPDVNEAPLNAVINLPLMHWSPERLECLKTENFTFTGNRDLNKAKASLRLPTELGFTTSKSSHLVGIWDYTTPWQKETRASRAKGVESIVLFALDQFCLIGYAPRLERGQRRSFAR